MSVIDQTRRIEISTEPWPVRRLATFYEPPTQEHPSGNGRLYLPRLQRLWSWKNKRGLKKQRDLIDSVLHNYPIPTIILNALDDGVRERWQIYDGRHRVETLWRFVNNKFSISVRGADIKYSDLTDGDRARFNDRTIPVVVTAAANPMQLADVFVRLNSGKSLTQADYCHASRDTELVRRTLETLEANKERFRPLFGGVDITQRTSTPDWVAITLGLSTRDAGNMTTSFERIQEFLDEEIDQDAVSAGFDALYDLYTRATGGHAASILKKYEKVGFVNAFFLSDWMAADDKEQVIRNWLRVITHFRTTGDTSLVKTMGAQNLTTAKIYAVCTKVQNWLAGTPQNAYADVDTDSDSD